MENRNWKMETGNWNREIEPRKPQPVILSEAKNLRSYGIHRLQEFSEEHVGREQTAVILRFAQNDTVPHKRHRMIADFHFLFSSFDFPISNFQFPISVFCFLLSAFCFLAPARAADAGNAEALIEAGHWKRARAIVEPRVAANPRDAQAVWLLSRIKLAFGDLDGALVPAQEAVALEDGNSDYHLQLAEVYGEMAARASMFAAAGLAHKFKGELDASLARNPKNLDALDALMQYSYQAPGLMGGDKGKARSLADQLVQLSPVHGYLAEAELAREAKDEAKVEESFRQAVKADPKNYEAQTALAGFYTNLSRRNTEEAEKHARDALRLDPSRAKAYSILAKVLALERRWNELEAVLAASEKVSLMILPLISIPRTLCWKLASNFNEARHTCGNTWGRNRRARSRIELMPTGCWG